MTFYAVNHLLRWTENGSLDRVLWIDLAGAGAFVIDINAATALPRFCEAESLEQARSEGRLVLETNDPTVRYTQEGSLSKEQTEKRHSAWKIVQPLVKSQPAIFLAKKRGPLIREAMAKQGVTKQTVYRILRRYWQRGMTKNALLPDYYRSGAPGVDKPVTGKKRGRPRKYGESLGMNVDAEARKRFRSIITLHYAKNSVFNMAVAYRALISQYYSISEVDESTGRQRVVRLKDCPSITQFRYWYERDNDIFKIERTRRTPRVYDKDMRALMSTSMDDVIGPGSRYQIDATIADVYLVSRYDTNKIVGRPVLYVLIDVFSCLIVGIWAGFEGPSWVGAMMALANTAADKVEYCRQYGIDIQPQQWPCQVLPEKLLSDRGESAGKDIETLIDQFDVHLETAAPYRADWKGIVEQQFRTLQADFSPYVPGYVQTDYRQRGGEDYRLDAVLNIDEFTRIIIYCVVNYNTNHAIKGYHRDPDMIADNVKPVPAELWEWGAQRRNGDLTYHPYELVRLSLLPTDNATVTESGIFFYGCYYNCEKAGAEHWFELARQRSTWKVPISYDPRCMDTIYLHDSRESFITCNITNRRPDFRGKSIWEIDQINQLNRSMLADHAPTEMIGDINMARDIGDTVAGAIARKALQSPPQQSKRARTSNIRANRAQEKKSLRKRDAFHTIPQPPAETATALRAGALKTGEDDFALSEVTSSLLNFKREKNI